MSLARRLAIRASQTARAIARDVKDPPTWVNGHYYSPVPSRQDRERAASNTSDAVGVDLRETEQLQLFADLDVAVPRENRWQSSNGMFGPADAAVLRGMLLKFRPARLVEVGSGFSTALALDVRESDLPGLSVTCIEPYADRLRSRLRAGDDLTLLEQPVQDVPAGRLAGMVDAGDFVFIDSTHVAKAGSDVGHLLLDTLPRLAAGTIVHVHDIFWPFEYPAAWLEEGRAWNEAYLLRAFLTHNADWEILLFSSWVWSQHPRLIPEDLRGEAPGSIWLRRRG